MIFGSVCSGIEAASVAWKPLGWKAAFFSEIEKFPSAVLDHHYPTVPNLGDMTKFKEWPDAIIDVLVGGTPCQSFSIAGLRKGLDDPRGNLMLTFGSIAAKYRSIWLVWENVYGVLSSNGGRDFASFLGLITGQTICVPRGGWGNSGIIPGYKNAYGVAYRVLDAQYAGVPQRRRRVFVVGHLGNWRRAAAVLFERHSLSGNPAPSREKGQRVADSLTVGANQCLGRQGDFVEASTGHTAHCLNAGGMGRQDYETETLISHSLRGEGFDASEDGTGRGTPLTVVPTLTSNGDAHSGYRDERGLVPVAWSEELTASIDCAGTIQRGGDGGRHDGVMTSTMQVRRLTPRECERLQGFPDDYTLIPGYNSKRTGIYGGNRGVADGPRYKALGNSMAVPVMRWIGARIEEVQRIAIKDVA